MKSIRMLAIATGFIISVLSVMAFMGEDKTPTKKNTAKTAGNGFVVLELFTSEGCSSCPPADELLAKIQQEAQGKAVYLLAYHVDYWNRLGWKDIFSSADFSKRQMQYGHWLSAQIYTPQVVVNGTAEFVGSDEPALRNAISNQQAIKPSASLALQARQEGEKLIIQYQSGKGLKDISLLVAIVQKAAQSKVERGENAGHTLSHVQIVRKIQRAALDATGTGSSTLILPKEFNAQNWEVLGLIQNQTNGEILAATRASFNTATGTAK